VIWRVFITVGDQKNMTEDESVPVSSLEIWCLEERCEID
jgi:hypothetical protein